VPLDPVAARISALTGTQVRDLRPAGAQHGTTHYRATLTDGREVFAKVTAAHKDTPAPKDTPTPADPTTPSDPVGPKSPSSPIAHRSPSSPTEAEARGLNWLAAAGAVPLPEVLGWDDQVLILTWLPPGSATPASAAAFGRDLARLHAAGAGDFGAPWPGFIASLPLDNTPWPAADGWPRWYAERRVLPFLRRAADDGTLGPGDVALVERVVARIDALAGPDEPPSRLHGDCWSGNVLWSGGRGWLIDPAAHGGHRETDLAMLALFGAPHHGHIMRGYQDARRLAAGWPARVPLHQLYPLLVHVCLFGAGYREQALAAARAALAALPQARCRVTSGTASGPGPERGTLSWPDRPGRPGLPVPHPRPRPAWPPPAAA
jgi:fructosamine-3-kinase